MLSKYMCTCVHVHSESALTMNLESLPSNAFLRGAFNKKNRAHFVASEEMCIEGDTAITIFKRSNSVATNDVHIVSKVPVGEFHLMSAYSHAQ